MGWNGPCGGSSIASIWGGVFAECNCIAWKLSLKSGEEETQGSVFNSISTMPYGMYLSAAGANVQNHRLEVLSNNLANINTPGFKPHLAILQARGSEAIERGDVEPGTGTIDDLGGGVSIQPSLTQFKQGPVEQTKRNTDFAINDDKSFFVVQRGDDQLLTRSGNFIVNSSGLLTNPNGDPVLSTNGGPIQINPLIPYNVRDDGVIQQAGQQFALMLATPKAMGDLTRVGDTMFKSLTPPDQVPNNQRQVVSGYLEKSAVEPTTAMMELIESSRLYEANLRLIQQQDQAIGNLVGRILKE